MEVYYTYTNELNEEKAYSRTLLSLPDFLREMIERRGYEYKLSGLSAYGMLVSVLNKKGIYDRIRFYENGKPYIEGNPVYFSLSHTRGLAVCAVSDFPVGIDAEMLRETKMSAMKRFTQAEQSYIHTSDDMKKAFFTVWTGKESAVKVLGGSIFSSLDKVCTVSEKQNYKTFFIDDYVISLYSENDLQKIKLKKAVL